MTTTTMTNCLWFDGQAEEAVAFYMSVFKDSKTGRVAHYSEIGQEVHHRTPGTVMTIEFELNGQKFMALNGGPEFKFTEAVSFIVECKDQKEVDYYWNKLTPGGDDKAQACGWLKDRYGVSWQITPHIMAELIGDQKTDAEKRAMQAMMEMKKLDIAALERAYAGEAVGAGR